MGGASRDAWDDSCGDSTGFAPLPVTRCLRGNTRTRATAMDNPDANRSRGVSTPAPSDRPGAMPPDASDVPLYNTAAVVRRTGVPAATFRAWERRYGLPKPNRDPSGQRLYSERDIHAIHWLSEQTARGVAISRAVAMLRGGYAGPEGPENGPAHAARSFEALRGELSEALLAFASARAEAVLTEALALFSIENVCLRLLQPVLV